MKTENYEQITNTSSEMAMNNAQFFAIFALHAIEIINSINQEDFLTEEGKYMLLNNIQAALDSLQLCIPEEFAEDGLYPIGMLRYVGSQLEELARNFED